MPPHAGSTPRFGCGRGEQQSTRQVYQAPAPAAAGFGQKQGCGRRAAGLVGGGIAAAFFASLERCACVDLRTTGDDCDCDCEAAAAPLLTKTLDDGAARAATAKTKSSTKRSTSAAGARKGRRGGFVGCCDNLR
ncbi:uncharacterized protein LOC104584345 [Brachypodium distachyon]|uniref:Uncharacterized protein n=1 Tax=Brachypodium distachyon TaxID=15368 RepID=A0A0Q3IHE5_BRADI|nr:uncharacterized protein LOC104584345 [Brachypodium distachyon]KQJ85648.1 hypothetical protein BRADI_4g00805v3 [Brachypodium distachyon]|eukprot:XP_010236972.1 uncharacterized protein LOC104584345 [Brachypodium distachyon]